ncbi:MAG: hypothetical protein ACRDZM_05980, partial [Acidimicrobiia bacterium]
MSTGVLRRIGLAALLLLLPGCSPDTVASTISDATSTTREAEITTTTADTGTTTTADGPVTALLSPFSEMGPGWVEQVFPYGEGEEFLGTSPGGEGLMFGPEYGTQTADGTWWFLDAANLRIAHFDAEGTYLDQVVMPEDLLVDGIYFQYQMPQALDDGTIVGTGWRSEETSALLRIEDGAASGDTFDGTVAWVTTDGESLYGLPVEGNAPQRLDPDDPGAEPVDWFEARDGSRYLVTLAEDVISIELPDAATPSTRTVQMRFSEDPSVIARGSIEVETGEDGTLFILIYGVPISDEVVDIGGLVTIGPHGAVSETRPVVNLFSMSDTGSPAHLGVTPETSTPWIMVVGEDGVHVHTRSG